MTDTPFPHDNATRAVLDRIADLEDLAHHVGVVPRDRLVDFLSEVGGVDYARHINALLTRHPVPRSDDNAWLLPLVGAAWKNGAEMVLDHLEPVVRKALEPVVRKASGTALRVIVESPFAGANAGEMDRNLRYLRAALADCLHRGEAPFASHAIYTQPGVLRDSEPEERRLSIEAGFAWREAAERTVVYGDLGISSGMRAGIEHAESIGQVVEYRTLLGWGRTPTGQDLEYERDFWQAKVGALLTLIETDMTGETHKSVCDRAYRIVNTDRSRLNASSAVAQMKRLADGTDAEAEAAWSKRAHPSHKLRSSDASTFDVICDSCGRTDETPGGWGALVDPCPALDTEEGSP